MHNLNNNSKSYVPVLLLKSPIKIANFIIETF